MLRQLSNTHKVVIATALICLTYGLSGWGILSWHATQLSQQQIASTGNSVLDSLSEQVRTPLFQNDKISIQVALRKAASNPEVISASILDIQKNILSRSSDALAGESGGILFSRDIEIQDTLAGTLNIVVHRQLIEQRQWQPVYNWLILWLLVSAAACYLSYSYGDRVALRLRKIINSLPGKTEPVTNELSALELKLQPLLANVARDDDSQDHGFYGSLIGATIKNRQQLEQQLSRQNLESFFAQIDYCMLRALELYGGERIAGDSGQLYAMIRSTQFSRQHLLVCLMASYTLQQLLNALSESSGIDLEISWTLHSRTLQASPRLRYDEQLGELKAKSQQLGNAIQEGLIVAAVEELNAEQLNSLAHFQPWDQDCFVLASFSEQRQLLLEKQVQHLSGICLNRQQ